MDRNLSRRVEVVFPIEHTELKNRLVHEILAIGLADNTKASELLPDGTYRRVQRAADQPAVRSQERFLEIAAQNAQRRTIEIPPPPPAIVPTPPKARGTRKRPAKASSERPA
jgi:polyphosphate kinase